MSAYRQCRRRKTRRGYQKSNSNKDKWAHHKKPKKSDKATRSNACGARANQIGRQQIWVLGVRETHGCPLAFPYTFLLSYSCLPGIHISANCYDKIMSNICQTKVPTGSNENECPVESSPSSPAVPKKHVRTREARHRQRHTQP